MSALKQKLRLAANLPGLSLEALHNNEPGELIADFSPHFTNCVFVFKHAEHAFDRETYIEKVLQPVEIRDGERRLNYKFIDSKDDFHIQVSDVIAGFLGRHFTFLQNHSLPELRSKRASFSETQTLNLELLQTLIDRSDDFSDGLLHTIIPLDTGFKNDVFLHGQNAPEFLG